MFIDGRRKRWMEYKGEKETGRDQENWEKVESAKEGRGIGQMRKRPVVLVQQCISCAAVYPFFFTQIMRILVVDPLLWLPVLKNEHVCHAFQ
jgi:hypothetical protein